MPKLLIFLLFSTNIFFAQKSALETLEMANDIYYSNSDSSYKLCMSIDPNDLSKLDQGRLSLAKVRVLILMTEYEQTEKELLNAESIFKELEDQKLLARTYSLRSILLGRLGEHDEELKSLLKAYEINLKIDNYDAQVSNLQNLSLKYLDKNNLDSTKIILKKLDQLKAYIVESDLYYYNQNWGKYYSALGEYEIALDYYNNALNFAETYDMVDSKATMLMCIGEAYKQKGEVEKAEKFSYMSYAFSDANNPTMRKVKHSW